MALVDAILVSVSIQGQLELLSAGNLNELNEVTDEQNPVEGEDTYGESVGAD